MPDNPTVRLSLRTKWTFALLVTVMLPMALFAVATARIQKRGLEDAEHQLEVAVIDHVTEAISRTLRDSAEVTHRVGQLLTDDKIAEDVRLSLAEDSLARATGLAQVAIYTGDGKLIDAIAKKDDLAPPRPPEKLPDEVMKAALAGAWLQPDYVDAAAGQPNGPRSGVLRYVEAVVKDGQTRALVLGSVTRGIGRRLEEISRDRFEDQPDGVLLLDEKVRVLAGPATGPLSIGTVLAEKDIFSHLVMPESQFSQRFASATEFRAEDGREMMGTVQSLPSLRFAVAVRRPMSSVYVALSSARRLLAGAGLLLALLAIVAGAVLAARTTRPVRALVELTRAYARRDFQLRSNVKTGDELELLGASMTQMADQLSASEKEIVRRAAVESDLSRYLPAEVAKSIAAGTRALALGGERRQVSILFADVVSFTSFAEGAPPEKVVAFLNELFTVLTEVVFRHGGTVDKFIGDCVMAIFGAPGDVPDHAVRALSAAEDMHRFVEANSPAWKATYGVEVRLGIGVNAGEALVGNLGSEARMEYTAIGDVVNVAARLEGLARPGQTLVTEEVARAVGAGFTLAPLGDHPLRGKQKSVAILELQ